MCIWTITDNLRLFTQVTEHRAGEMPCVAGESFALHNICRGEGVSLSQGQDGARRRRQPENVPVIAESGSRRAKEVEGCGHKLLLQSRLP